MRRMRYLVCIGFSLQVVAASDPPLITLEQRSTPILPDLSKAYEIPSIPPKKLMNPQLLAILRVKSSTQLLEQAVQRAKGGVVSEEYVKLDLKTADAQLREHLQELRARMDENGFDEKYLDLAKTTRSQGEFVLTTATKVSLPTSK